MPWVYEHCDIIAIANVSVYTTVGGLQIMTIRNYEIPQGMMHGVLHDHRNEFSFCSRPQCSWHLCH